MYLVIEEIERIVRQTQGELLTKLPEELLPIAYCESRLIHDRNGKITKSSTKDYGLLQINHTWIPHAKKLGYDIFEREGNIKFGKYLLEQNGLSDWRASKHCWRKLVQR